MINRSNFNLKVHSILNNTDGTIEMDFHLIVPSYFGYGTMSLFGNYLIVYIIRTNTSMKTAINYLVFNQTCADILITSLYLVDTVRAYSYHGLWFGGNMENIICKLYHAGFYILQSFSIFLLVAIAADRFYAVTRPLKRTPTDKKNNCNIVDVLFHSCHKRFCSSGRGGQEGILLLPFGEAS